MFSLLLKELNFWILFVVLKDKFDNMSYRLRILRLKLLCVESGPYGLFIDQNQTNSQNNRHVRNWLVFKRNETILYMLFTNTQKSV